jgi:hypothetical protein
MRGISMKLHTLFVGGLLAALPFVCLSSLQAQTTVAAPVQVEVLPDTSVPLALPENDDSKLVKPFVIETAQEKSAKTPPPAPPAAPAITSAPGPDCCGADTCGTSCCHPFLSRLFHPFHCGCHPWFHHCWHRPHLFHGCCFGHWGFFHRGHGCGGCGDGVVMTGTPELAPMTAWQWSQMNAYAYYPNYQYEGYAASSAPSQYAVAVPADVTKEKLAAWKELPAQTLYGNAVSNYWDKDYRTALEMFWILVEANPNNTRAWYFKALTERAIGDLSAAKLSAQRGAATEYLDQSQSTLILSALERVQGQDRQFLRDPRSGITNADTARMIASQPLPNREFSRPGNAIYLANTRK